MDARNGDGSKKRRDVVLLINFANSFNTVGSDVLILLTARLNRARKLNLVALQIQTLAFHISQRHPIVLSYTTRMPAIKLSFNQNVGEKHR